MRIMHGQLVQRIAVSDIVLPHDLHLADLVPLELRSTFGTPTTESAAEELHE